MVFEVLDNSIDEASWSLQYHSLSINENGSVTVKIMEEVYLLVFNLMMKKVELPRSVMTVFHAGENLMIIHIKFQEVYTE